MNNQTKERSKRKNILIKSIVGLIIGIIAIILTVTISETKIVGKFLSFILYFCLSIIVICELIAIFKLPKWSNFIFFIPNILNFTLPFEPLKLWFLNDKTRWVVNDFITNQYIFDLGVFPGFGYLLSFFIVVIPFFFIKNDSNIKIKFSLLIFIFITIISMVGKSLVFINVDSFWFMVLLYCGPILCDTFAFFGGITIGNKFFKRKLAPKISPNKTIEGAIVGFLVTWLILFIVFWFFRFNFIYVNWIVLVIVVPILLPIVAIFGDLIFSAIKRFVKIKDFSNLLPGHGGLLDRFDSILITTLAFATLFIVV